MANLDFDLGVLERQLHQARQNAIQAELAAAGLQEIGHPMLLCVLGVTGERRPGTPVRTQRELARLLHVSPAGGDYLAQVPGAQGIHLPGARRRGCPVQPGAAHREGAAGGGRLPGLPAAGVPADVRRSHQRGAGRDAQLLPADAGQSAAGPGGRAFVKITYLTHSNFRGILNIP